MRINWKIYRTYKLKSVQTQMMETSLGMTLTHRTVSATHRCLLIGIKIIHAKLWSTLRLARPNTLNFQFLKLKRAVTALVRRVANQTWLRTVQVWWLTFSFWSIWFGCFLWCRSCLSHLWSFTTVAIRKPRTISASNYLLSLWEILGTKLQLVRLVFTHLIRQQRTSRTSQDELTWGVLRVNWIRYWHLVKCQRMTTSTVMS